MTESTLFTDVKFAHGYVDQELCMGGLASNFKPISKSNDLMILIKFVSKCEIGSISNDIRYMKYILINQITFINNRSERSNHNQPCPDSFGRLFC